MSRNCPLKNGSTEYGRLAPTQVKAGELKEEPKKIDSLMTDLKNFLTTEEAKDKYFRAVVDQGFV
jgi:hypothetical protein